MENSFSPVFKKLRHIKFTVAGKCKLSGFSDEALLYADDALEGRMLTGDPFGYFFSIAKRYSQEHLESVDTDRVMNVIRLNEVAPDDPCVQAFTPNAPAQKSKEKKATPWPDQPRKEGDKKKSYKPLRGRSAAYQVSMIKEGMLKGICPLDDLKNYIEKQREYFGQETEGLFDLYTEMVDATPSETVPISKEHIQSLLPF